MAATPPGARKPPNRGVNSGFSLSGLDLGAAGDLVDPGTLALLNLQQQNPPEQAQVPGGGGILSTLLAGVGGGLIGQPGAGAGLIQQQQERIAQTEKENRALLQQHKEQTLGLVQAGISERVRVAERAEDKQAEALALTRQAEIDEANALVRASQQRVAEMKQNRILTEEQAEQIPGSLTDLILEAGDVADQLDRILDDPEILQFDIEITDPASGQSTPFRSAEDIRNTFNLIKNDILRQVSDARAKAEISADFDKAFGPIERRLKEFERRIAASKKPPPPVTDPKSRKKPTGSRTLAQRIVEKAQTTPRRTFSTPKKERAVFEGGF